MCRRSGFRSLILRRSFSFGTWIAASGGGEAVKERCGAKRATIAFGGPQRRQRLSRRSAPIEIGIGEAAGATV